MRLAYLGELESGAQSEMARIVACDFRKHSPTSAAVSGVTGELY